MVKVAVEKQFIHKRVERKPSSPFSVFFSLLFDNRFLIGHLQDPVTWYGILHWDANDAVGLSKQRKVGLDWYEFLCFGSPTASFVSQCNLFRTM